MVMRGEIEPEPKQINAAKVLIEYEEPKLSAVAVGHMDGELCGSIGARNLALTATAPTSSAHPTSTIPRRT